MTQNVEMNLRTFDAVFAKNSSALYEEYYFGTNDSFVVVSLDWTQEGKLKYLHILITLFLHLDSKKHFKF